MTHHKRAETACRFNRGDILVAAWRTERKKRRTPKDQRQTSRSLWSLWTARSPTDERFRGRYVHPYLKSTKLPIQKEAQAQSRWRPRAPDVANDPRGRTGVIPCGVMRLIRSAPAHARDQIHLRLTDFRHASPACDRAYNRSRAARPARLTAVETYLLARCDHSLLGGLRRMVGRTGRRLDRVAGPPRYGGRRSARCARPRQPGDPSVPPHSGHCFRIRWRTAM